MAHRGQSWTSSFPESWLRAWAIGTGLVLLSVALFIVNSTWVVAEPVHTIVRDIASVVFTIGGVAVVYDISLRGTFTRELYRLVGLRQEVMASGFARVVEPNGISWDSLFAGGSDFRFVLADGHPPFDWMPVLAAAHHTRVTVCFFLPNPDSVGGESAGVGQAIRALADRLEEHWKRIRDADQLSDGSQLDIYFYNCALRYKVISTNHRCLLMLEAPVSTVTRESPRGIWFEGAPGNSLPNWLATQLRELEGDSRTVLKYRGSAKVRPDAGDVSSTNFPSQRPMPARAEWDERGEGD